MNIKILEKKKNPLLHRDELKILIEHPNLPTPKRDEIMESLKIDSIPELILIKKINTKSGIEESKADIEIYEDKKFLPKLKQKKQKKKE